MSSSKPELRWGIIGTGWIASIFVNDLLANRPNAPAIHMITAIGSSSKAKGAQFVDRHWKDSSSIKPTVYETYQAVYTSTDVDIVYIATPHTLHKQNCLDAMAAGKHVLCEKPFTINASEAQEVITMARANGVYVMEAVWTRFFPMVLELQNKIQRGVVGRVRRSIVEIGLKADWAEQPSTSRLKDPALGGGALLNIGFYPLTFASVVYGDGLLGEPHPKVKVTSQLMVVEGVDESDAILLTYTAQDGFRSSAICLATVHSRHSSEFGRIEGTEGSIILFTDTGPSSPRGFQIRSKDGKEEKFSFSHEPGTLGFVYEADGVAMDIAAGKLESDVMPLGETLRMMRLMDEIRAQNNFGYPQDDN
ncbi:hypothetical protein NW762_012686 [Fusarium torreyae]|uniref:D-xylose 1-dehydrogenase (NADP(+), D-xylono-1,5-lactone-forming) n=1 Tax=Fusarium torreyae TaxID=1237075 RepID=A0A9W8RNH2_9HYPO|nr:hypothetical protein NW762_012686 [Fusarium torreyae]